MEAGLRQGAYSSMWQTLCSLTSAPLIPQLWNQRLESWDCFHGRMKGFLAAFYADMQSFRTHLRRTEARLKQNVGGDAEAHRTSAGDQKPEE
jgi:hypothetical protein